MKTTTAALLLGLALVGPQAQAQTGGFPLQFDDRFNPTQEDGFSGSVALGYSNQLDGGEAQQLRAGAQLRYSAGDFMQSFGISVNVSDVAGTGKKDDLFAIYDARFTIKGPVYGFILGRLTTDRQADTADEIRRDAFLAIGPGVRVINGDQLAWRVQAGVGVSYMKDGTGDSTTEPGVIASSRLSYQFRSNIIASDDLDILKTDSALRVSNDIGVSFRISDAVSTRVSYLTEYNDSRADRTENRLGVALVMNF